MLSRIIFIGILLGSIQIKAQYSFQWSDEVAVLNEGDTLKNAWAGGMNSVQFQQMDLNNDQVHDLVIFDRSNDKISTFLYQNGHFIYQPDYERQFPQDIKSWIKLVDYDCDGRLDLFTSTSGGIKVYKNVGEQWVTWELVADPLLISSNGQMINLQLNSVDIPQIKDLDNDGDVDLMAFHFAGDGRLIYYKNYSVEEQQTCRLHIKMEDPMWGEFRECGCGQISVGGDNCDQNERKSHFSGKVFEIFDVDEDEDLDLLLGEEDCSKLYILKNTSENSKPAITEVEEFSVDPDGQDLLFPAPFLWQIEDTNQLLVSTALGGNLNIDATKTSKQFKLPQSQNLTEAQWLRDDFLQQDMLDLGSQTVPCALDVDLDQNLDLVIGYQNNGEAALALLKNVGTFIEPVFQITSYDFLGLKDKGWSQIKPYVADINLDNRPDLIIATTYEDSVHTKLLITYGNDQPFDENQTWEELFEESIATQDNYTFGQLDANNRIDLIIGKSTGSMAWYELQDLVMKLWELKDANFLSFQDYGLQRFVVPYLFDLNEDGNVELMVSDRRGQVTIYTNLLQDVDSSSAIFYNSILESDTTYHFGKEVYLTAGKWGAAQPQLVVGNKAGGLQWFNPIISTENGSPLEVFLSPNPVTTPQLLKYRTNKSGKLLIYNALGQLVRHTEITAWSTYQMDFTGWSDGMYLFRMEANDGQVKVNRVCII